jgi:hypothetical protein
VDPEALGGNLKSKLFLLCRMAVLRLPLGIELDLILPTRYWNYSYNPQSKTGTLDFRWVLGSSFLKDHTSISHTGMKIDLV